MSSLLSKTTTTFNLGRTFANKGIKTLIVDADPQCNLTAYVLGLQEYDDLTAFYENTHNDNIYAKIEPNYLRVESHSTTLNTE